MDVDHKWIDPIHVREVDSTGMLWARHSVALKFYLLRIIPIPVRRLYTIYGRIGTSAARRGRRAYCLTARAV